MKKNSVLPLSGLLVLLGLGKERCMRARHGDVYTPQCLHLTHLQLAALLGELLVCSVLKGAGFLLLAQLAAVR